MLFKWVFGYPGYLLPWNEVAYWATTVGTEVAGAIPWVGDWFMELLRGGTGVGNEKYSRSHSTSGDPTTPRRGP